MRDPAAGPGPLGDRRVLVVEDEAIVAMLVEDELAEAGAVVLGPAGSVDEALQLIEAAAADGGLSGAVLDIDLEGYRVGPVADRLAALGVPFLFATGLFAADWTRDGALGGHAAAPVLQKPFDPRALVAAVDALTHGHH
jgi:DNA-binding response OmpR family regulator